MPFFERIQLIDYYARQMMGRRPNQQPLSDSEQNFAYMSAAVVLYLKDSPLANEQSLSSDMFVTLAAFWAIADDMGEEDRMGIYLETRYEMQRVVEYLKSTPIPVDGTLSINFSEAVSEFFTLHRKAA